MSSMTGKENFELGSRTSLELELESEEKKIRREPSSEPLARVPAMVPATFKT